MIAGYGQNAAPVSSIGWHGNLAATVAASLLARPIPQEYDASTVDELAGIQLRSKLWKSKKSVGKNRTLLNTDVGSSNPSREV